MFRTFCSLLAALACPAFVEAATVVTQQGANNPLDTGWGTNGPFLQVTTGPVVNDAGSGFDAWQVIDGSSANRSAGWYTFELTPEQASNAETFGWRLTANVRLLTIPAAAGTPWIGYRDGATTVQTFFGTAADGAPIINYFGGPVITHTEPVAGYNLFELAYDPVEGVSFDINGTEVLSGLSRTTFANGQPPQVLFGTGSSALSGGANFNSVQFDTLEPTLAPVPLPASASLSLAALAGLGWIGRRRIRGGPGKAVTAR